MCQKNLKLMESFLFFLSFKYQYLIQLDPDQEIRNIVLR